MNKRTPFQRLLIILNLTLMFGILAVGADTLVAQSNQTGRKNTVTQRIERIEVIEEATPTPTLVPEEDPIKKVPVQRPVGIEIPSISLFAQVEEIGVTQDNVMEVPTDGSKVGWYSLGNKPGSVGRAILNGHYDTTTGKPAVFYHLRSLNRGDIIYLKMEGQDELLFQVEDVISEPWKSFPEELIYGPTDRKELALITCDGVWNPIEKSYSKRLVVFATLWENKTL